MNSSTRSVKLNSHLQIGSMGPLLWLAIALNALLSAASATHSSLLIYAAGSIIESNPGSTLSASILGWFLAFFFSFAFNALYFTVMGVIAGVAMSMLIIFDHQRRKSDSQSKHPHPVPRLFGIWSKSILPILLLSLLFCAFSAVLEYEMTTHAGLWLSLAVTSLGFVIQFFYVSLSLSFFLLIAMAVILLIGTFFRIKTGFDTA